jgi:cyclophilin family peptidyl-prolyl cis-trans isomerase
METSMGEIVLELDRERAPVTVANFLGYVDRGAYDGTTFHRVVENFVIQGGGWTPELVERARLDKEAGRPDVPIRNEWRNGLKNVRGTIAMARDEGPDTATREFYINVQDNPKLDTARATTGNAGYAVFGRVVEGMEAVDRIRHVKTGAREVAGVTDGSMGNVPVEAVVIRSVRRTP